LTAVQTVRNDYISEGLAAVVEEPLALSAPIARVLAEQTCGSDPLTQGICAWHHVQYQLKTPYRDGTTHVIFEPLDLIARMAAFLVPKPRVNPTRF
jgi:hypothetical protein